MKKVIIKIQTSCKKNRPYPYKLYRTIEEIIRRRGYLLRSFPKMALVNSLVQTK